MEKNDVIQLEITGLTNEGSGVGRYEGMAVFVPVTAVGDVILCRIVKVLKSYAYGRVEDIITPSADRIKNDCPSYGKCGGCSFRHISYAAELSAKEGFVRDAFTRIGGLSPEFLPIRGSEAAEGYRNKLQMPVAKSDTGEVYCGFFSERSHRVTPVKKCLLQPDVFADICSYVIGQVDKLKISVYNEHKHEGVLRHIFLRRGHYSGEIVLCLVARRKVPEFSQLAKRVMERFPQIKGVVLNINKEKTNVILGSDEIILRGCADITDTMCGNEISISPKSFYQVNTPAAEALYRQAAEFAEPEGKTILDLYCGAGTIGLSMSGEAKRIIGAEIVPEAVENAKLNAMRNNITSAEFICADAGQAALRLAESGENPDVIILDPPRKGCDEATLSACAEMSPERIVMISCNAATAARDCKWLSEHGYSVKAVRAFDLFPRTTHVECVVKLTKESL
ncbi:MAG: 23S rRNA (uracil(1939)-C(5))-methyltransferase RlmD [Oscillospiraceae bacterium]|nr:23S rRNA (uracil(1939)-C(5))-methyltransferase RlmD [Oscillospiraceae bacterium]